MKILFLCNKDLASNVALNMLLPSLSNSNELHLWLSARVGNNKAPARQLQTLKFFEQDLFNLLLEQQISVKNNEIKSNEVKNNPATNNVKRNHCFRELNTELSSEIRDVYQINSPDSIANIKALAPDLIVSIRFGGILQEEVIALPKYGVINLHSGILPKYKGVMATFWALKNKDPYIGTTLHTIEDASIDTGQIIKISKIKVNTDKSYMWHVLELYKKGIQDILTALETLKCGKSLDKHPQEGGQSYFTFPNKQECDDFEKSGLKIIDEQEYLNFIRLHYLDLP